MITTSSLARVAWTSLRSVVLMTALAAAVSGCAANAVNTAMYSADAKGITYYLPRPRVLLTLSIEPGTDPGWVVGNPEYTSDTRWPLILTYEAASSADEELCVQRNADGTLATILFDSADRTGDMIVRISETVATLAERAARGLVPFALGADVRNVLFDPCDADERRRALAVLREIDSGTDIDHTAMTCPDPDAKLSAIAGQCAKGSVCYVTLTRQPLTVKAKNVSQIITVPYVDYKNIGTLDIKRVFMGRATTRLGFSSGALIEAGFNRPSAALEVSRLPLRVVNAVLDVPARFFAKIAQGFRGEADANAALAQLLNAQALLAQAAAKPTPKEPSSGLPSGTTPTDIGATSTGPPTFTSAFQCIGKKANSWLGS